MEFSRSIPISSECQQEQPLSHPCSIFSGSSGSTEDLFSAQYTEEDVSLEWLSIYVEDCFSNQGSCFPAPNYVNVPLQATITSSKQGSTGTAQKSQDSSNPLQNFVVPGKARSKRKRVTTPKINNSFCTWSKPLLKGQPLHVTSSDPPLLKQAYWLADSELIVTKQSETVERDDEHPLSTEAAAEEVGMSVVSINKDSFGSLMIPNTGQQQMPRRCSHCLAQKTPQWRAGPLGPKTLCNACGVRYKSGRLLPEYRPAKSPSFVSYLHSNSHKKIMEMRMAPLEHENQKHCAVLSDHIDPIP